MVELDETTKAKVLKQIEFYFSDSNLPKDKFLRQQVEAHPEGYVDLSLIISFQRMRDVLKLGAVRPEDVPDELVTAVAGALAGSQLMEVHSTGFQVRRKTALLSAKEAARAVDSRSLYVRPFPMDASLDQVVGCFQKAGVALNAVRLRRHARSKGFKGSVFVEAASAEEAQRVLGLALEFEGAPLRLERKQAYLARKIAERKAKKLGTSAEELTLAMLEEMDSDVEIPALTEINKDVHLPAAGTAAAAAAAPGDEQPPAKKRKQSEGAAAADGADADMADAAEGQAAAAEAEPEVEQYETGCILMLTLTGQPAESDPYRLTKMIKEALGPDKIRFVEQQRQQQQAVQKDAAAAEQQADGEQADGEQAQEAEPQQEGGEQQQENEQQHEQQPAAGSRHFMVRFRQPDQAQELLQAFAAAAEAGEPKQVAGCAAVLRLVKGEEEAQYYKRAAVQRAAAAKRGESGGGRGGRGGGRGGFRGGGRGRGGFRGGRGGRGRGRGRH